MDLDSTIATTASAITQSVGHVIQGASDYIPEEICKIIRHAYIYFPTEIDMSDAAHFVLYFTAASLILGILGRVALGKRSSLNHSLSSALAIAFVYVMTIAVYTFKPLNIENYLSPLPFVTFSGDYLILYPIGDLEINSMCQNILSLLILSFLVNLIDTLVSHGESPIGWCLLRLLCVGLSIGAHYLVTQLIHTYLPDVIVRYSATIVMVVLVFALFSGVISLIVGMVISVGNPFLAAMYSFFFSNLIGKQVSKAVFSSFILCGIFYLLDIFGYTIICINSASLAAFLPFLGILAVLWYLIGRVL